MPTSISAEAGRPLFLTSSSLSVKEITSSARECKITVPGFVVFAVPHRFHAGQSRTSRASLLSMFMAIYVKRDFRWYEVISRMLLDVLHEVSPAVEYYSIDEMFFRAEQLSQVFRRPLLESMQALQQRVLHEICVPVSIGVSQSKTLAKLGSDTAKPFGCIVLLETDHIQKFLRDRPVEDISGIGERSRQKLVAHGIMSS